MEFDSQSQCSDEGVELSSLSEHGFNFANDFMFSEDILPEFLEARTIYLLLPKNVPISRVARLQWLLDHLNTTIVVSNTKLLENSQNLEVISAIPREQNINIKCTRFLVTYRTELKFIAHAYRFVYCLDMSPSHANVDIDVREVLFDQILHSFKISIEGLSKQFTIPGNSLVFQPCIFITILANTPFFITPAQQVILKGIQMTPNNVVEIIKCVETHFHMLEGKIADACMQALDKMDSQRVTSDNAIGDIFTMADIGKTSKIPMVTPDANFVNMLRYSMLAISLLPETTLSHILVITDGIVSMPDSNVMETMLHQLHYDAVAVSFLKVGSSFHAHAGAGLVSYTDLLHFFAHSTLGTCSEYFPKIHLWDELKTRVRHRFNKPTTLAELSLALNEAYEAIPQGKIITLIDSMPRMQAVIKARLGGHTINDPCMSMNFYQETFLIWSFHNSYFRYATTRNCDNSSLWASTNDKFLNQRLPTLLFKRQTDDTTSASIVLLLARRMREGFTIDNVFYMNNNLEIKLIHQWKSSIYIHYKLMSKWPAVKNLTHFEVHICAPYEFLHDMTCMIKKETKSVFRQAIIQRFWSRLSQVSSGDLSLGSQLSHFNDSKDWYSLPDSVKSGLPVFHSVNPPYSDSAKLTLYPRDTTSPKFVNVWQGLSQMETNNWRKWFHTQKISLILTHDTPLPTNLHMSSCSSQRYQVVQCRQAVVALYGMLAEWASFELIENHTYLRLLYSEADKPPIGFCIVRVSSKFPSAVLNLGFSTNTPGQTRLEICDELKAELSSLSYIPKAKGPSCCVLLQKPLEKILIRYERIPASYTTVVFPDGTQPPDNSSCFPSPVSGSLFTTLSRYLFHKRWIWSASHPPNPRLPDTSISRILNTLTRMRLKEGYHFAYSSSGIVTMVLEVWLEPTASCVVQYVLFPPHYNWGDDYYSGSEEEENEPISEMEAELQMVTEVWIEPQYGKVVPSHSRISYVNNRNYYQIADAICKIDFRCINVLLTMEHMSLMCQNMAVHNLPGTDVNTARNSFSKRSFSRKNSRVPVTDNHCKHVPENGSPWYPIASPRIEHIPFKFDPIRILHLCQQTELLFSMLREEKSTNLKESTKADKANKLLLDNIFEHFSLLHDRELGLSKEESDNFTREIITRHTNKYPHTCPISDKVPEIELSYRWRCYIKGVSVTHVILTFVPATVSDLRALTGADPVSIPSDLTDSDDRASSRGSNFSDVPFNTPNSINLPVYVYDCPLKLLVNAYVGNEHGQSSAPQDVYEDHRFKFASFLEEESIQLKGSDTESFADETDPPDFKNVRDHCNALVLTHSKCFSLSLFLALHMGIYIHNSDVQSAMDLCEEEIIEIDITDYLMKICSHLRQVRTNHISTQVLHEAYPCSELKNLHMLIKKKFFKMICASFIPVPSNGEYYFFKHLCIRPEENVNDSDDEVSACASEIEFKSERDMSIFSEGPHLLTKSLDTGLTDIASMSDVSPLFLHFICTLRYSNGGNNNTSVRVLPTCLGELIQTLDSSTEYLDKTEMQITLDIFCLTLPPGVQNILNDYSQQGLRSTSFCSESGFQHSTSSSVSETSLMSDIPTQFRNLTELQKQSVDNLREEIKWLLEDEICTTLLDYDHIDTDTLGYVIDHIVEGHRTRPSCKMNKIILNFVYTTSHSHDKFREEFSRLPLPLGYKLCHEGDYYYVAKDHFEPRESSEMHINQSFSARSSGNGDFAMDIHDLFKSTSSHVGSSCREDTMSQQSEITSGSVTGTDGGYDEDDSEDEEDCEWLTTLNNKRSHMPNFWLILRVEQDLVHVYFHCRFTELNTHHVEKYNEIERAVCDAISDLCKKVNQLLLLQSLYESKNCDLLLEADDTPHNDVPLSKNASYNKLKGFDPDTSDDSETMMYSKSMSEASLHLKPGYFTCSVVWEKIFVLHPRLKTGPGGKSGISRGITALKNILEKFSVSNRHNMFVYQDKEDNVFYLRLYESANISSNRLLIKQNDNESSTFSRSPSIASLPIGQNNKPNLAISDQSIASIVSSDMSRPRVRSFGERESRNFDPNDSKERINEDTLILRVHGITKAGTDVQCDLVQVLQNRLDDAVLDSLSVMLARNAMCPLSPEDVRFIQKPFQKPEYIIRLIIQDFALQWHKSNAFIHYLKQNLLQFLNVPKYTDNRSDFHFKDYSEENDKNILKSDNILIYNQSQAPSAGSRGIACIVLALIYNPDKICKLECENHFETVFITKNYEACVNTSIIEGDEKCPESYLEFRLWKQGRINLDNLSKKLKSAVSQATWDIVTEYYLLKKPLCVEEYKENLYITKKKVDIDSLSIDLDNEIEYNCEIDLMSHKNIREKVLKSFPKKIDAHLFPSRKHNKRSLHPNNLKASRIITYDTEKEHTTETHENGVLSIVYSKFLPSWLEFGHIINTSAVRKHVIKLVNRHMPNIIVKELITMLDDSPKAFRAKSTHSLSTSSEDVYVPFNGSGLIQKYVIISRNFQKWQNTYDDGTSDIPDALNPQNLKHSQKFVPTVSNNILIPRQKIFWICVECDNIVIYTYNWAKDNIDKLINNCVNLTHWLAVRSCFLNSASSQKLGLFYNQPLTRKCFMLPNNNYYNLIGSLDAMSKFPRDHTHRKGHQSNFNLPIILEAFRDSFCNTKYTSTDIVVIFIIEMREMKSLEKKNRDEMKKLHSMYQSRTGTTSVPQLNLLMQNSRILHYVHTPLLFLPRWRLKSAATRDHSLYPSQAIQTADKLSDKERELWHSDLCYAFFSEYRNYLHTLGFTPLQIDSPQSGTTGVCIKDKSSYNSVFYIQRTILGGILIFTVSFEEPFFVTKLHAIECNRLQNITSRASVNGFTLSFLDECDKVKILMHLHSFTYDYHMRCIYNYISGNLGKIPEKYNVHQFLDDFLKYYNKAPNYARNLVHTDTLTIENLVTEGKQLYDYLLSNVNQYGFKVLEMNDCTPEFILVQVTTARQVSYKDSQDRQHTDDFDMTLVVYNQCAPFKHTDNILHLKYYLILTSKREIYPMYENEQKLGKFRTVSSAGTSTGLDKSINELESSLPQSESNDEGDTIDCANDNVDEKSLSRSSDEKPIRKLLPTVTICQESVNYLGYYSSHEQIMQQLILDKAEATQNDIEIMVSKGMVHCRTNLLWNRLISPQESTPLTFDEFIELKNFAKLKHLCHLHPNLGPLLNQPLTWYQGLAKLLLIKYLDQHRIFTSVDGHVSYYVILHPRYYGAFMLLSVDLHMSRGDLYAVYREPHKQEGADPLGLGYEKSLRDGFVNCICFYLWKYHVRGGSVEINRLSVFYGQLIERCKTLREKFIERLPHLLL